MALKIPKYVEDLLGRSKSEFDMCESNILEQPVETHYCGQSAIVTIYDPIMQKIEHLIV